MVNFVPIVLGNGKIHLEVAASISQPNSAVGVSIATAGSLASAPGLTTRGAQVAVQLEDGQTLAIGGLIQNTVNGSDQPRSRSWAICPIFGARFPLVTYTETEEELLILVTPRLVDPMACTQLKPYPGRETRSADDYELFLEGIMEAPRGQRDVFPNGHYTALAPEPGRQSAPVSRAATNRGRASSGRLRDGELCDGQLCHGQLCHAVRVPVAPAAWANPASMWAARCSSAQPWEDRPR